jgi:hypothetical protein
MSAILLGLFLYLMTHLLLPQISRTALPMLWISDGAATPASHEWRPTGWPHCFPTSPLQFWIVHNQIVVWIYGDDKLCVRHLSLLFFPRSQDLPKQNKIEFSTWFLFWIYGVFTCLQIMVVWSQCSCYRSTLLHPNRASESGALSLLTISYTTCITCFLICPSSWKPSLFCGTITISCYHG